MCGYIIHINKGKETNTAVFPRARQFERRENFTLIEPKIKTMPLAVGSAFKPTKELLELAFVEATKDPRDPDPDLELQPEVSVR